MSVLDQLRDRHAADQQNAKHNYQAIVRQLAIGDEDPSLAAVESVLAAAGKSADELTVDVRREQKREELRRQIRAGTEAEEERETIGDKIAELNVALERTKAAHDASVRPLQARLYELQQVLASAANAERQLRELCGDEDMIAETH